MPARTIVDCQKYLILPNCAAILISTQPIRECTAPRYIAHASSLKFATSFQTLNWGNANPDRVNRLLMLIFTAPTIIYTNSITLPPLVNNKCIETFDRTLISLQTRPQAIFIREISFRKCMLLGSTECATLLSKLVNLEYIDISFTRIKEVGKFSSLRWLKELLAESVVCLSLETADGLQHCPRLETLDVSGTQLVQSLSPHADEPEKTKNINDFFRQFKSLKRLYARNCSMCFCPSGVESLTELDLSHQRISRWRYISDDNNSDDDVKSDDGQDSEVEWMFAKVEKLRNLRKLSINNSDSVSFRRFLDVKDTLLELNANECDKVKRTGKISELIYLTTLNMARCWRLRQLYKLDGAVSLEYIDFTRCHRLRDVNVLSKLSGLRTLKLSETGIDTKGTKELSALVSLLYLDVSECPSLSSIDHFVPGMVNLEYFDAHSHSTSMHLRYTTLTDCLKTFTSLLPLHLAKNIKHINMLNTSLTIEDLEEFCCSSSSSTSTSCEATKILLERAHHQDGLVLDISRRHERVAVKVRKTETLDGEKEQDTAIPDSLAADDGFMDFLG